MRFKIGLVAGFALGYWYGATPPDHRRATLDRMWLSVRDNPRVQRVTDTVARDAHRLGDAVERRIVERADGAVDVIARTGGADEADEAPGDATTGSAETTGSGRKSA